MIVLDVYLEADRDYSYITEKDLEVLFLQHLNIGEREISYNHTISDRIDQYAEDHGAEWFGSYTGMRVFLGNMDQRINCVYVMSTNPELKEKSRAVVTVYASDEKTPLVLI